LVAPTSATAASTLPENCGTIPNRLRIGSLVMFIFSICCCVMKEESKGEQQAHQNNMYND